MVSRTRSVRPVKQALVFLDRQIIGGGPAHGHVAVGIEFPVFVTVGTKPVSVDIAPFEGEAYRDTVVGERPQFLDQAVVQFRGPFAFEKGADGLAPIEELKAVAPLTVRLRGQRGLSRVTVIPGVLGSTHFLGCGFSVIKKGGGSNGGRGSVMAVPAFCSYAAEAASTFFGWYRLFFPGARRLNSRLKSLLKSLNPGCSRVFSRAQLIPDCIPL